MFSSLAHDSNKGIVYLFLGASLTTHSSTYRWQTIISWVKWKATIGV